MSASGKSCCTPSADHGENGPAAAGRAFESPSPDAGSTTGMVKIEGGAFRMGAEGPECWVADGEGPVREFRFGGRSGEQAALQGSCKAEQFVLCRHPRPARQRFSVSAQAQRCGALAQQRIRAAGARGPRAYTSRHSRMNRQQGGRKVPPSSRSSGRAVELASHSRRRC